MRTTASLIVLSHLVSNAHFSGSVNPPRFPRNGRETLIHEAINLHTKIQSMLDLNGIDGIKSPQYAYWCAGVIAACQLGHCFETAGISTAIGASVDFLAQHGFQLSSQFSLEQIESDDSWCGEPPQGVQLQRLVDRLRSWFFHPELSTQFVTPQKLKELYALAEGFVADAEHIPFGSLASAIGRRLDRPITLWPFQEGPDAQSENPSSSRAIRYTRQTDEQIEEIIFFKPSANGPSALDYMTRYTVAHELAHIALGHAPGMEGSRPHEEIEAHCLATVFMTTHGAPTGRTSPTPEELARVLDATDLPTLEKIALMASLREITEAGTSVATPSAVPAVGGAESDIDISELQELIAEFERSEEFRSNELTKFRANRQRLGVEPR